MISWKSSNCANVSMGFWLGCMSWTHTKTILLASFSRTLLFRLYFLISTSVLPLPSSHCNLFITASPSPTLLAPSFPPHVAVWTWHRWLGCGARGRNCPVSTRSCSETCRTSSTRLGTWPSTATSWAARACNRPSSHCSPWSRRTSPSYMKVDDFVEIPEFLYVPFFVW